MQTPLASPRQLLDYGAARSSNDDILRTPRLVSLTERRYHFTGSPREFDGQTRFALA
jgi:hypothetical protein